MGWNSGYTIFEATVIGAYDLGKLDKDLLTVLMEPYRGTDIDSGGSCDLTAKDGKGVEQIVIETWGLVSARVARRRLREQSGRMGHLSRRRSFSYNDYSLRMGLVPTGQT